MNNLKRLFNDNRDAPRCYEIRGAAKDEAEILLYDVIGGFFGIDAGKFTKDLKGIKAKTIHLRINSPGGDFFAARAIATAIADHPATVIAHVDGLSASAASFLMLSADRIVASEGSFVMVHNPWSLTIGDANDHTAAADLLGKIQSSMADSYAKRTGKSTEVVQAWMDAETWFGAEGAMEAGLVDEIHETIPTAASASVRDWNLAAYRNAPVALTPAPAAETEVQGSAPDEPKEEVSQMENPVVNHQGQSQAPDLEAIRAEERRRISEIQRIGAAARMSAEAVTAAVDNATSVQAFREQAFEAMLANQSQHDTRVGSTAATVTRDAVDTRRAGFVQALLNRANASAFPLKSGDNGWEQRSMVGMGLMRVAEECVRLDGQNPSAMSQSRLVQAAMSTSDFPYLLGTTADVSLKAGYAKAPQTWLPLAGRKTVSNFKLQTIVDVGMSATFPEVPESGEFKQGYLVEGKDTFRCYTYGQIMAFTRQVIINDELGALTDIPMKLGMKWAIKQASLVWGIITANAALVDGYALFQAANHANLIASGTAISVDSIGIMRKTMRAQTDLSGDLIDIMPKYLVVPVGKEQLARQYMSSAFNPTAQTGINPWQGSLEIISEPRLDTASATAWYVFADPAAGHPVVIAIGLAGNEGVYSETEYGFDVDGVKFKARADFGAAAVDYRGAVKNNGA